MTKRKPYRILAFDISLSSPGVAVVDVLNGKPKVIAMGHVKTSKDDNYAIRTKHIESYMHLFIRKHSPYDAIVREGLNHKMPNIQYAIFSAWNAIDRALRDFDLKITADPIGQAAVKKLVVGKGKAEKDEVAEAVRKITGYKGEFAADDESDACAIAVAYGIQTKLIPKNLEE
jgi:crossover junction endodeoxyribonuclease RuvC